MSKITNENFNQILFELKKCRESIYNINSNFNELSKDLPIHKLRESLFLCSGAFYQLYQYQRYYPDINEIPKNNSLYSESWKIFDSSNTLQEFSIRSIHPSGFIKTEFGAMCIANAAIRLPSAGSLVSESIQKSIIDKKVQGLTYDTIWPFHKYFDKKDNDWERRDLQKLIDSNDNECKSIVFEEKQKPVCYLSLLLSLRDEYGHSEFQKGFEDRTKIRKRYYEKNILESEIEFIIITLKMIFCLCQYHARGKINLCCE